MMRNAYVCESDEIALGLLVEDVEEDGEHFGPEAAVDRGVQGLRQSLSQQS